MGRTLHADTSTAVTQPVVNWGVLVEFEYSDTEMVRVWTGRGALNWGGNIFGGLGEWGGVSQITENSDGALDSVTYTLSGVDEAVIDTLVAEMLDGDTEGRLARCWVAFFDEAGDFLGEPVLLRQDVQQDLSTIDDESSTSAALNCSPPGLARGAASTRVYSDADHQAEYPGDDFFKNIETVGVTPIKLG